MWFGRVVLCLATLVVRQWMAFSTTVLLVFCMSGHNHIVCHAEMSISVFMISGTLVHTNF
jgi:hypothetical protein